MTNYQCDGTRTLVKQNSQQQQIILSNINIHTDIELIFN